MKLLRTLPLLILMLHTTAQISEHSSGIISYIADPKTAHISLYWRDDRGKLLSSIRQLKSYVESKHAHLVFAMNGGMYRADHSPQGLFIQDGKELSPLDTASGKGNFYLKPNGVFYLSHGKAAVCKTASFVNKDITFATQSGPMLISDGEVNAAFKKGSDNLNIRNGVGILPDGSVLFAISRDPVNFYDFALFFRRLGCRDALYLDGFVSRAYIPSQHWEQLDGDFGVMIGVTE